MGKPRWRHYCDCCIFLGAEGAYDLYYCPGPSHGTRDGTRIETPRLVARGRNRTDISSIHRSLWRRVATGTLQSIQRKYPMGEVLRMAVRAGLLGKNEADLALS
jgi:hypothetical protein